MPANTAITPELRVFYDGACQLCRAEMHNLMARDVGGRIEFVDASHPKFDPQPLGVTLEAMMNALHVRRLSDDAWLIGVPAFEALYAATGQTGVARALRHPVLAALAERTYPWVVRHRHHLPQAPIRWVFERARRRAAEAAALRTQACRDGSCRL
ncbi:putative DCC family thiol-disulfide oxidoreductase YuxK [Inhella inkyongensis]|uniref:Putative DCC family thiol-disulfide oxidoreductase YuxK n=1 Tax=Inhella inkyongensis TaxID=392593 RepID=A0A840S3G5_9BURK|nr:DUF393 domain-containing protein [Inhella inkyongensis]MBB5203374.1 putative DCC family thiol-disulfide oxidoreductase YuxK [Inhella inkyongensis]